MFEDKRPFAYFGLILAAAFWGSTFFLVKDTINSIDPVILIGYRFTAAAIILAIFLDKKKLFHRWKDGLFLGTILLFLYLTQTIGLKYTTASNSGFITGLFVLFLPVCSFIIFKKLPTWMKLVEIGMATFGLWLLTGGMKDMNLGDMLTLMTAIFYALHILFADKFIKDCDPYILSFQQFLVTGIGSLIIGLLIGSSFELVSSVIPSVIFLTLFPTLIAFVIQLLGQKIVPAVQVSLIFSLEPVFGAIFAWTLGGEQFIIGRALGGLLIFIAMILSTLK
jgi:drug/metabolite transporter (DMT)-like permease